jgi:glycosyltransferase involved in cell wall biosynthesis
VPKTTIVQKQARRLGVRLRENKSMSIDGLQLQFPNTGLAVVTSELISAIRRIRPELRLNVFLPEGVDLDSHYLNVEDANWIEIKTPRVSPDYFFRFVWGQRVTKARHRLAITDAHFIPYLYNYGALRRNIVLIPDLVYRLYPDYGTLGHSSPWWQLRGRLPFRPVVRRCEEWLAMQANRLIVYSKFVRDHATKELGANPGQFTIIPLAAPSWIRIMAKKNSCQLCSDGSLPDRFVLYVGGYAVRKNVPMLLRVCGRVHEADSSFRCVFVGLDKSRIATDSELAAAYSADNVRKSSVLVPRVRNEDLYEYYNKSSFAVYPSHSEGFGLPVIEAGTCERLCLCGDNSSMREIQLNSEHRIDSNDEDAWFNRVLYYWKNQRATENAGKECKLNATNYSWDISASRLLNVLNL